MFSCKLCIRIVLKITHDFEIDIFGQKEILKENE